MSFSDRPQNGSTRVELPQESTVSVKPAPASTAQETTKESTADQQAVEKNKYERIEIIPHSRV